MIKKRILLFTFFSCSKIEKDNFMRRNEKASSINFTQNIKQKLGLETLSEFVRPISEKRDSNKKENSNTKRPKIFKREECKKTNSFKEEIKYLSFEDLLGNMILMLSENENQILDLFYKYKDSLDPDLKKLLQSIDDNNYTCLSCSKFCSSFDQIYLIYSKKENIICFKCEKCKKEDNKVINLNENIFEIKTLYFFPFEEKINEILSNSNNLNFNIELLKTFIDKLKSLYEEKNLSKNIPREKSKRKGINVSLSTSRFNKEKIDYKKEESFDLSLESSFQIHENDNSRLSFIDTLISGISSIESKNKDLPYGGIELLIKKFEIYILLNEIKVSENYFADHRKKSSIPNSLIETLEKKNIEELENLKIQGKKDLLKLLGIENSDIIQQYDENKLTISEFEIIFNSYNDFIKSNKEKSHSNYISFSNFENLANKFYIDDFEKISKNYFNSDPVAQNYINNNLSKLNINQILIILECKDQAEINFVIDKTTETSSEYNEKFIFETKEALSWFREIRECSKYYEYNYLNSNINYPGNNYRNSSHFGKNVVTVSTISSIGSFPKSSDSSFNHNNPLQDPNKESPYTSKFLLSMIKKF